MWDPITIATVTGIGMQAYGAYTGQQAANKYASQQSGAIADANAIARENLAFQRERYDRWRNIYGPIEENLGQFYSNLSADDVAAMGITELKKSYDVARNRLKTTAAQRGVDESTMLAMERATALEEAEAKAGITAQAPFQLAQAQQGFLAGGHDPATGVSQAYTGVQTGAYNMAQIYGQRAQQYGQQVQQNIAGVGQSLTGLAALYTYNKQMEMSKPQNAYNPSVYSQTGPYRQPSQTNLAYYTQP